MMRTALFVRRVKEKWLNTALYGLIYLVSGLTALMLLRGGVESMERVGTGRGRPEANASSSSEWANPWAGQDITREDGLSWYWDSQEEPWVFPLEQGVVTDVYGERVNPVTGKTEVHRGVDLCDQWGAPVRAVADGVAVRVNIAPSTFGNWILLRHDTEDNAVYTLYAHLHSVLISEGDAVLAGEQIGTQGGDPQRDENPGESTGSHLHFELRLAEEKGSDRDPSLLLGLS